MVNTTGFLTTIKTAVKDSVLSNGTHMAVGTDDTAPAIGDTALGAEVTRKAIQESTTGVSDIILSLYLNSAESNGNSLVEVGLLDAAAAGNLLVRDIFTAIAKNSSTEVWIDIEEQITVIQ